MGKKFYGIIVLGVFLTGATTLISGADQFNKLDYARRRMGLRISTGETHILKNDFIEVVMDDYGVFTVGTVKGDPAKPNDDNKDLLFGHPDPWSSDAMILVDGNDYSIHSTTGSSVTVASDALYYANTVAAIQILERFRIVASASTGNADTIEFYYKLTNSDVVSHDISFRVQLDTLLGSNDGAPFRVAGTGAVITDTEFLKSPVDHIPFSTLVLDNLLNPQIIALMTFKYLTYTVPDRVVLGYWGASHNRFDYTITPDRSITNDSSVIIYWGYPASFTMAPGESREFSFTYGIGGCAEVDGSVLSILICGPLQMTGQITGSTYQYFPNPFPLTTFVSNLTPVALTQVDLNLNKTSDIELLPGDTLKKQLTLGATEQSQVDWKLTANGRYTGNRAVVVSAAANGSSVSGVQHILVKSIPNAVYGIAADSRGTPISGATITVYLGTAIVGNTTSQSDGRYAIGGLNPGTYRVRMTAPGGSVMDSEAKVVASEDETGLNSNPLDLGNSVSREGFVYPNPIRENRAFISFYTAAPSSGRFEIFNSGGHLIDTIIIQSQNEGWSVANWDVTNYQNGVYLYLIDIGGTKTKGKIALLKRS